MSLRDIIPAGECVACAKHIQPQAVVSAPPLVRGVEERRDLSRRPNHSPVAAEQRELDSNNSFRRCNHSLEVAEQRTLDRINSFRRLKRDTEIVPLRKV